MAIRILLFCTLFSLTLHAQRYGQQRKFSNEFGFYAGSTTFFTDFGERSIHTQAQNSSFNLGVVHYFNFAYRDDFGRYTRDRFFNDHFKVRTDINFAYIGSLRHQGGLVAPSQTSLVADQLRAMKGELGILTLGAQIEFDPLSIRGFGDDIRNNFHLHPFISFGFGFSFFNRNVSSSLGPIDTPATTPPEFLGGIENGSGTAWSAVTIVGFRYRLRPSTDLVVHGRYQAFFSDSIDGINDNSINSVEHADYLLSLNAGLVFYLNF